MNDKLRLFGTDGSVSEHEQSPVPLTERERELDEIRAQIWADRDRLMHEGIAVWTLSDGPMGADYVQVGVEPLTPEAVAYFARRFGDSVHVVEEGPPQPV
jgi:hypothetical protein